MVGLGYFVSAGLQHVGVVVVCVEVFVVRGHGDALYLEAAAGVVAAPPPLKDEDGEDDDN